MTTPRRADPEHAGWLLGEADRISGFARASVRAPGGFWWLDDGGRPLAEQPLELWITARMTHVFALEHLRGRAWAGELVDHGVRSLRGVFHDHEHGGWFRSLGPDGPLEDRKTAYEHAFVMLTASSATVAGRPGADGLLEEALAVFDRRFWDDEAGMAVDEWDRTFGRLDDYRGANSNMHTVEALLAAADVTGDDVLRERALRITSRVVHDVARAHHWRIPEHFDTSWRPLPDYNRDEPAHPFRPFGATVGHSLEWSRLVLALRAALGDAAPAWMLDDARALFDAGVREGWSVDGAPGFVYTVDWDGAPVVRQRMHWVHAEAIAASATLAQVTGDPAYTSFYEDLWVYADTHLVDRERGSWRHELGPDNRPAAETWTGKPDAYHAYQAALLPLLPPSPTPATAVAGGLLP